MKPFLTLKSVDEILAEISRLEPLDCENIPLDEACGRALGRDFAAPAPLPGFARATVDGFACRGRDIFGASETSPAPLELVGSCVMGKAPDFALKPGQAAPILTGAMLPEGADCAAMIEYSRPVGANLVEITRSQAPGDNIVGPDDDAARGALLIPAGKRLRPQEIGCFAAFGIEEIPVRRRPRAAIVSTGDEVVPIARIPAPGQVRDVNSHSVAALCRKAGAEVARIGIIRDDRQKLAAAIARALAESDIVIVSGGSSAGARDFSLETFLSMPDAELIAHGAAISPGKPFILVKAGKKCLVGLPGHVSGALVCARVFLAPILRRLQGLPEPMTTELAATLSRSIASAQGRRDYIRCKLARKDGVLEATPLPASSAVISGMVEADGLIVCPENREGLAAGEKARVELF